MKKLTKDEKTFLDRVCFRLYGNPLKWRTMLKEGFTQEEIFQTLVDLTNAKKEKENGKRNNEDILQKQYN